MHVSMIVVCERKLLLSLALRLECEPHLGYRELAVAGCQEEEEED